MQVELSQKDVASPQPSHHTEVMKLRSAVVMLLAGAILANNAAEPATILARPPSLPQPTGQVIRVSSVEKLYAAVTALRTGETILVEPGAYRLTRPIVLQHATNVSIRGASGDPSDATFCGSGWETNKRNDDLVHVGACDGVAISGLTFADCRSYGIKIEAENAPRNVHIYNCRFRDIGVRAIKGSAGKDPSVHALAGSVRHCTFENTKVPPAEWLSGGDYISAIDMMALEKWTFSDNSFRAVKGRNGGGRAAIFLWVRSKNVVVERNLIVDCDRGIAFGNPGQSTANQPGEQLAYVTDGTIRNNFVAGGADCGIEIWHSTRIKIINNSIWRPERNWRRGIRIGAGNSNVEVVNNLVHGEILLEGSPAELRHNIARRLEGWFRDPSAGDLRLTKTAVALDAGGRFPGLLDDIRQRPRSGLPDLGAWEQSSNDSN